MEEAYADSPRAANLGAPLKHSKNLHLDLQNIYKRTYENTDQLKIVTLFLYCLQFCVCNQGIPLLEKEGWGWCHDHDNHTHVIGSHTWLCQKWQATGILYIYASMKKPTSQRMSQNGRDAKSQRNKVSATVLYVSAAHWLSWRRYICTHSFYCSQYSLYKRLLNIITLLQQLLCSVLCMPAIATDLHQRVVRIELHRMSLLLGTYCMHAIAEQCCPSCCECIHKASIVQ